MPLDENGQVILPSPKRHLIIEVAVDDWSSEAWDDASARLTEIGLYLSAYPSVRVITPSMSRTEYGQGPRRATNEYIGWEKD